MNRNTSSLLRAAFLLPLCIPMGLSLVSGCATNVGPSESDEEQIAEDTAALTAEQCDYFDVNGSIQICHQLGNGKFKILRLNEQACINAHGDHATDYVTSTDPNSSLYDPTCGGNGCLPLAAPCDETLPCCDGSTCTDGTCVATEQATCPCAAYDGWNDVANTPVADQVAALEAYWISIQALDLPGPLLAPLCYGNNNGFFYSPVREAGSDDGHQSFGGSYAAVTGSAGSYSCTATEGYATFDDGWDYIQYPPLASISLQVSDAEAAACMAQLTARCP